MTLDCTLIPTGRVWVDPGGPFGLVPRALWEDAQPPNERGLSPMDLNSLLIRTAGKTVLVDTGLGDKLSDKGIRNWNLEWPEGTLLDNLAAHGVKPEDVDIVIDTHLHADHCGGNTKKQGDDVLPTFPNAEYIVQRMEFADASHPDLRTRATYLPENFVPVWTRGQFRFLHGDAEILPGVRCVLARGHTRAIQCVLLETAPEPVLFMTDLATFAVHFERTAWVTAYDVEPLETIASKQKWQPWALANNALLVFQHDAYVRTARLTKDEEGRLKVVKLSAGSVGAA
ncbi:MAG: MBL fold metallo-hydrolase [Anaerolineae bacterium]|nr:MAG: MBL fold metallo-hydrolase [Anaerolineae bacterium]